MLILSRKETQNIMIGDGIVIQVVAVSGGQVRIGIDAPRDIAVHREEIYNKIQSEKSIGQLQQDHHAAQQ